MCSMPGAAVPSRRRPDSGGYSTSLYLGLGLGSFALGLVITEQGYGAGFVAGAGAGAVGTALAATLWITRLRWPRESVTATREAVPRA